MFRFHIPRKKYASYHMHYCLSGEFVLDTPWVEFTNRLKLPERGAKLFLVYQSRNIGKFLALKENTSSFE